VRRRPDRGDALIVGYALVAALGRPLTAPAAVAVVLAVVAAAVLLVHAARRPPAPVRLAPRHAAPWVGLLLLAAVWELTALTWDAAAGATLSLLLDPVLDTYPGRVVGWLAWLAAGRWLVTR
jgi:hypothetical protein